MSLPNSSIVPAWAKHATIRIVESIRKTGDIIRVIGEELIQSGHAEKDDFSATGSLYPKDLDHLLALRESANVAVNMLDEQYSALYNYLNAHNPKARKNNKASNGTRGPRQDQPRKRNKSQVWHGRKAVSIQPVDFALYDEYLNSSLDKELIERCLNALKMMVACHESDYNGKGEPCGLFKKTKIKYNNSWYERCKELVEEVDEQFAMVTGPGEAD